MRKNELILVVNDESSLHPYVLSFSCSHDSYIPGQNGNLMFALYMCSDHDLRPALQRSEAECRGTGMGMSYLEEFRSLMFFVFFMYCMD